MKEAKRRQITAEICKQVKLMRKGGANQTEIGALLGINPSTISRIESAGFDVDKYMENKRASRVKEAERRRAAEEQEEDKPIPGQIEMELVETKPQEMSDQVKMMRFIASQVDKLSLKLDHLNDTLSMILRAVRKE